MYQRSSDNGSNAMGALPPCCAACDQNELARNLSMPTWNRYRLSSQSAPPLGVSGCWPLTLTENGGGPPPQIGLIASASVRILRSVSVTIDRSCIASPLAESEARGLAAEPSHRCGCGWLRLGWCRRRGRCRRRDGDLDAAVHRRRDGRLIANEARRYDYGTLRLAFHSR